MRKRTLSFKPRANLLLSLGDQLIRDEGIALFELLKNSHDAGATKVIISLKNISSKKKGEIKITDNGSGIDWNIIIKSWFEPGAVLYKKKYSKGRKIMGKRGIGRFASYKLGMKMQLITRSKNSNEVVINIDWGKFRNKKYLKDISVKTYERKPMIFKGKNTGTQLIINNLWHPWRKETIKRILEIICSIDSIFPPLKRSDSFEIRLQFK